MGNPRRPRTVVKNRVSDGLVDRELEHFRQSDDLSERRIRPGFDLQDPPAEDAGAGNGFLQVEAAPRTTTYEDAAQRHASRERIGTR